MSRKSWLTGVGLILLGGLGWASWVRLTAVPCVADRVRMGEISEYLDVEAKTRVERSYKITMPIAGRIQAVELVPGSQVSNGQIVAELVPEDLNHRLTELSATVERLTAAIQEAEFVAVEQAEVDQSLKMVEMMRQVEAARKSQVDVRSAELAFAGSHLERMQKTKDVYPKEEVESAESQRTAKAAEYKRDYHDHLASLEAIDVTAYRAERFLREIDRKRLHAAALKPARVEAEARLEQARLDVERSRMTSPIEGVVLERFVSDERLLPAGAELLELARLEDLEVAADVLTQDAARIKQGGAVEIYGPTIGPNSVRGTIVRVEPTARTKLSSLGVEEQRVNVIISFEPGVAERLMQTHAIGVGYRVRVRIILDHRPQVRLVPRFAIFRGPGSQWLAYVVRRGIAVAQPVRIGLMNDEAAEIVDGLDEGDVVLLTPESHVSPGTRVRPVYAESGSNTLAEGHAAGIATP